MFGLPPASLYSLLITFVADFEHSQSTRQALNGLLREASLHTVCHDVCCVRATFRLPGCLVACTQVLRLWNSDGTYLARIDTRNGRKYRHPGSLSTELWFSLQ